MKKQSGKNGPVPAVAGEEMPRQRGCKKGYRPDSGRPRLVVTGTESDVRGRARARRPGLY